MEVSSQLVDKIKSKVKILDLVTSERIQVAFDGTSYSGTCPACKAEGRSFLVVPDSEIFSCYACGVGGDIFSFISGLRGCNFDDACKYLAAKYQISAKD